MEQVGIKIAATDDATVVFDKVGSEAAAMQRAINKAGDTGAAALDKLGISAKQTAFAMRQVPMQFTDIVVSLQGGQAPLTVLLQQGGQLKDLFGGIGPAARAMGGYVAGLVNPFTLSAAAAAVLGLAYYEGSKEATAYSKAIILSGNAAGTTVGQMQAMATAVAKTTGATTGAAAEALAAVAGTGMIDGSQLDKLAATSVRIQRETGIAVKDTVAQFVELAKDPVDASAKLNEATNYLTKSVYDQIRALQDQGKTAQAAAVATSAYADAMTQRTGELQGNLGTLERAWCGITDTAKGAWDAMLNVGRAESLDDKMAGLQSKLAAAQQRLADASKSDVKQLGQGELKREIQLLQDQVANINEVVIAKRRAADQAAKDATQTKAHIEFVKSGMEFESKAAQMAREIAKARELGALAGEKQADIEARIVEIRKKYKESRNTDGDAYASIAAAIAKENDAATQALGLGRELTQSEKFRIDTLAKLDEALRKKQITSEQAIKLEGDMVAAQEERAAAERELFQIKVNQANYNDQIRFQDELSAGAVAESKAREQGRLTVDAYVKSITEANDLAALELSLVGKTTGQRELALAQYRIELALKEQIRAIDSQAGFDEADRIEQRAKARAIADKSLASVAATQADKADQKYNTSRGITDAAKDYLETVASVGEKSKAIVTDSFKGMEDALVGFVKTGKLDFSSLADSIISDMIRMSIQQTITAPLAGFVKGLFSFDGGGYTGSSARSGGLDGKGGFMAMLHPQETVVDHTKGQGGAGNSGGVTNNYFNFTVGDVASVSFVKRAVVDAQRAAFGAQQRSAMYA